MFSYTVFLLLGCLLVVCALPTSQIENCGSYADIVFILDSSGSIGADDYVTMHQFVNEVVVELGEGDNSRFGYCVFDDSAWVEFYLNNHTTTADVLDTMSNLTRQSSGNTNTASGLAMARSMFTSELGDRMGHTNIGIILTDGQSNNAAATAAEADANKQAGIRMISIGVGTGYNLAELNAMASEPVADNVFTVDDFTGLTTILSGVCEAVEEIEIADPESERSGGYDCAENNPCSPSMRTPDLFYYRHADNAKFVQCSPCGDCFEMNCGAGTVWNETLKTCACTEAESVSSYNCADQNPCSPLKTPGQFYYPHTSAGKFVQCTPWDQCYEMPCGGAFIWSQEAMTCILPP